MDECFAIIDSEVFEELVRDSEKVRILHELMLRNGYVLDDQLCAVLGIEKREEEEA